MIAVPARPDVCVDARCTHEDHCAEAHRRKAHRPNVVPAGKMDTPSLVKAVCSCGGYASSPGSTHHALRAHSDHRAAKLDALAKQLPCVDCPAEVLEAVFRRRAAVGS